MSLISNLTDAVHLGDVEAVLELLARPTVNLSAAVRDHSDVQALFRGAIDTTGVEAVIAAYFEALMAEASEEEMERELGPAPEGDYSTMHKNWLMNGGSTLRLAGPESPEAEAKRHLSRWVWKDGKWSRGDGGTITPSGNEFVLQLPGADPVRLNSINAVRKYCEDAETEPLILAAGWTKGFEP